MSSLSLISLNIEKDKHFDQVLPFLESKQSEIACFMEVFEADVPKLEHACHGTAVFAAMNKQENPRGVMALGITIVSRLPLTNIRIAYYAGPEGDPGLFDDRDMYTKFATMRYLVLLVTVEKGSQLFRIATTHFPWTPKGVVADFQRMALIKLGKALAEEGELILCGDFNAPRGGEIFTGLASTWKDNIPLEYQASLDPALHKAGQEVADKMVDGLFTTPYYRATGVELISGLSDHCAVTATIERSEA